MQRENERRGFRICFICLTDTRSFQLRDEKGKKKKKKIHVMLPTSPSKKHSTPGDWYGCFDKPSYFSALLKMETKKKPPALPNMKIKPNPLGGPGYANICFSPYPTYYEHYDHTAEGILRKSKWVFALRRLSDPPPIAHARGASRPTNCSNYSTA